MRSILLAGLIGTAAAGCAPAEPPASAAETDAWGQAVRIGATERIGDVAVTPLAVLEDSRCPPDVTCVWAGRVLIRARIEAGGRSWIGEMELGKPVAAGTRAIVLARIWPEHVAPAAAPGDYRFAFAPAD
jgi:hypothetical protein